MPGPARKDPSTTVRRNNPKAGFRSLPAGGRTGATPEWPLPVDAQLLAELEFARDKVASTQVQLEAAEDGRTRGRLRRTLDKAQMEMGRLEFVIAQAPDAEIGLWTWLWSTPQAVLWEESYAHREVAMYVRWQVRAEASDIKAAGEARQRGDRLGMTPLALAKLQSEVENADEAADKGDQRRQAKQPPKKTTRKRPDRGNLYLA